MRTVIRIHQRNSLSVKCDLSFDEFEVFEVGRELKRPGKV